MGQTGERALGHASSVARQIPYDLRMFDHGSSSVANHDVPLCLGFAGFRLLHNSELQRNIFAFLGASRFLAVGTKYQYGVSARGLALDTVMSRPEEFPRFTDFWPEPPGRRQRAAVRQSGATAETGMPHATHDACPSRVG